MPRQYTKSGKERKKHVMCKRQNKDAKRSTETPNDKRGTFWNSDDISQWHGAKCTARAPYLF